MRTEAVVFVAPNSVEYDTIDCPDPGDDDVVVRTTYSWISNGTEGSYLRGERSDGDTPFSRDDPAPFPVVAGYQRVGVVEQVGSEVSGLEVGQTVFATVGCVLGMHHTYGGQVARSVSKATEVFVLPEANLDSVAFAAGVLAQVGFNAGSRPMVQPGDGAVVVGDGMVGQWTAQTLASRGCSVLLVGRHDYRLELFEDWPSAHVINEQKEDWPQVAQSLFPTGAQVCVDTVGSLDVLNKLDSVACRFGQIVSAGFYGSDDAWQLQPPRYKELSIHLVSGWTRARLEETLRQISMGALQTLPLITHVFPVREAADAWQLIETKSEPVLGVLLDWTEGT